MWGELLMKRILLALMGVAMLAGVASAATVMQGNDVLWNITVSFNANAILLDGIVDAQTFGIIPPSPSAAAPHSTFSNFTGGTPRCTVDNLGYATISYQVSATIGPNWTLGNTPSALAANQPVLYGIFTRALPTAENAAGIDLSAGIFGGEDIITATVNTATASVLAEDSESNTILVKGNAVDPTNSSRSLRFRLDSPLAGSNPATQTIVVNISAI
jgi:hypothetical protein